MPAVPLSREVSIRPLGIEDAPALVELLLRNRRFLEPFEPTRADAHFTVPGQRRAIAAAAEEARADKGYAFGIFLDDRLLIGRVSLSNVFRRAWQNANLGYFLDHAHTGRGYMTAAVQLALAFAFASARLHRVQAATLEDNAASIRVLEKAGFRLEGTALRYLHIGGRWRDHRIFAITVEEWSDRQSPPC